MRAKQRHRPVEVLDAHRQAPEARRMILTVRALWRVVGFLDQLENLGAEAKERLTRRTGGRGLLADATQVQPRTLKRPNAAIQRWGERDDVIDRHDPVRMRGRGISWRTLGYGCWQPVELRIREVAQRPAEDASLRPVLEKSQPHPAEAHNSRLRSRSRAAAQRSQSSPTSSSSIVGVGIAG